MRIVSISLDRNVFNSHSVVFQRMRRYAVLLEEFHIICFTLEKDKAIALQEENLFLYPTNSKSRLHFFLDAYTIGKKIIQQRSLDRTSSIVTTQDPFETAIVGYLLKRKFGLSLNIQDHGNFFESRFFRKESILNLLRYRIGRILLKKSDSIRTVSLREKKYIESHFLYPEDRVANIPIFTNWRENSDSKPKIDIKQKYPGFDFYILTMCRLEKVKNIPLLIAAFAKIHKRFPRTLLLIVGNGSQKKRLEKMINREKLQGNVIMEDWTEDTISFYKTADLFVLSSFSEGWGLTVIEAASSLCPIIMTDTGCAGEFIRNGINGWITKTNDVQDLTRAIADAIENKERRKSFAKKAFQDLVILPDEEATRERLKKIWDRALPSKSL